MFYHARRYDLWLHVYHGRTGAPLAQEWVAGLPQEKEVLAFVEESAQLNDIERESDSLEKRGVFTGRMVINPYNGEQVPLWVGDYVLMYGTGAVMAVPAHDTEIGPLLKSMIFRSSFLFRTLIIRFRSKS